jgi:hypothetical protein
MSTKSGLHTDGPTPTKMSPSKIADAKKDLALMAGLELAAEANPLLNFRLSDLRGRALKALLEWVDAEKAAGRVE